MLHNKDQMGSSTQLLEQVHMLGKAHFHFSDGSVNAGVYDDLLELNMPTSFFGANKA